MKRRIRLTESDLHRMIKESVKQVLRESNYTDDMIDQHRIGSSYDDNKKRFDIPGTLDYDNDDPDITDYTFDEWCKLSDKLKSGGEGLDQLTRSNPIMKKWYQNLRKKGEKEYSWDLFDEKHDNHYWNDYAKSELNDLDKYYIGEPFTHSTDDNYSWDDYDDIENMRSDKNDNEKSNKQFKNALKRADSKPLHRKGSLNRDL